MATPSTVATWALNGTTTQFDVPFDYLSQTFVKVTLIGTTQRVLVLGTDYQFITPTRIQTFLPYGPPQYTLIEVRRETSTTERLVEFHDASILTASDMNTADLQVLHVAEEARNAATETIGVNNDGELDARGRRIVNLATPRTGTNDAVSMSFYQGDVNGVFQAKVAAEAARDAAQASQTSAASSASSANTSRTQAASSATAAAGSATTASTEASEASASAVSAGVSKADSATNAQLAYKWAQNPEGEVVNGGMFSAFHWAKKSEAWANAAATSVLPNGSVSYEKLNADLQTGRWVAKGGDEMTGNLSMKAGVVLRHTGGTAVASYSLNLQSYEGAVVNSWMIGVGAGVELRHGSNNNSGRMVRFEGVSKDLYAFGNVYANGTQKLATEASVTTISGRVTKLEGGSETKATSATYIEFDIPDGATEVSVELLGLLESNHTVYPLLQYGPASGVYTADYSGYMTFSTSTNRVLTSTQTDGVPMPTYAGSLGTCGVIKLVKGLNDLWTAYGSLGGYGEWAAFVTGQPRTIVGGVRKLRLWSRTNSYSAGAVKVSWK